MVDKTLVNIDSPSQSQAPENNQGNCLQGDVRSPATVLVRLYEILRWNVRVLLSSAERFYWDDALTRASSLAYTSLLSLVPVTVLAFGLFASFAVSTEYIEEVRTFIFKQFVPDDAFVNEVLGYIRTFSHAISDLNVVFVLFLVITSLLLINSIEYALNATWQVFEPRPVAQRLMIFSSIVLIAPVLLLSVYYFAEQSRLSKILNETAGFSFLVVNFLPFSIDFVAFTLLYWLIPKAPVKLSSAMYGAAVSALAFTLAKYGFATYLRDFATYNALYKSIAAVPVFLLWLYLSWAIVLFGAECSYQSQYLPRFGRLFKRTMLSVGDARLVLAVQALVGIAKAFAAGVRMPNDIELAEQLGCSSVVLKPTLDALERAGIVARGDSRDMPLTLMRSPERIIVQDLMLALFPDLRRDKDKMAACPIGNTRELGRLFSGLCTTRGAQLNLAQILDGSI